MSTETDQTIKNDPMYPQAVQILEARNLIGPSAVQRILRVGYNRACRLLDAMEGEGLVERDGARFRKKGAVQ